MASKPKQRLKPVRVYTGSKTLAELQSAMVIDSRTRVVVSCSKA